MLKATCEHGKFLPALERLGLSADAAQRYMAVRRRFANAASARHLEAVGITKMVALLPLDDDQIKELSELGQTGELALDDVARMSVKELRASVRKARTDKQRLESVGKELQAEVVALRAAGKVVAETAWPAALEPISDQVAAAGRKLAQGVSELAACRVKLFEVGQSLPEDEQAKYGAALVFVSDVYQQALAGAERALDKERLTFDKTLAAYASDADAE